MTDAKTLRHAGVLPSFAVRLIKRPLKCSLGDLEPERLLSWVGPLPSQHRAVEIREVFLHGRRSRFDQIWPLKVGVNLPQNWRTLVVPSLHGRLQELVAGLHTPQAFADLSLRQVKEGLRTPLGDVFMVLAQIEASYWTQQDSTDCFRSWRGGPGGVAWSPPVEVTDDWRMKVRIALRSEWVAQIQSDDLRFEAVGPLPLGQWLAEEVEKKFVSARAISVSEALVTADKCNWLEELGSVVDHAFAVAPRGPGGAAAKERWKAIFLRRFSGPRVMTLQDVGDEFGLTRERVRQICDALLLGIQERPAMMPALDKLLAAASRMGPVYFGDADEQLTRLLGPGAGLASALDFAQTIGRESPTRTVNARVRRDNRYEAVRLVQGSQEQSEWIQLAIQFAHRDCRVLGCTNFVRIAGLMSFAGQQAIERDSLLSLFKGLPGFRFLDEEGGWFTLPRGEDCVLAGRVRKLFSVCHDSVGIDDLMVSMATDVRLSQYLLEGMSLPPLHVVCSLFKGWPWLVGDGHNNFRAEPPIDRDVVLSEVERLCLGLMEGLQETATRTDLSRCIVDEHGFSTPSLSFVLSDSPIFAKVEQSVYRINGRRLNVEGVMQARIRRGLQMGSKAAQEIVIDPSQPIPVAMRQSTGTAPMYKRVVYLPSIYGDAIHGTFKCAHGRGPEIKIRKGGQISRLAAFADSEGIAPGQSFMTTFDMQSRSYTFGGPSAADVDLHIMKEGSDDFIQ